MDGVINVAAILLIVAYVGLAIWVITKRQTVGGSIGASVGFMLGGLVIVPVAGMIASLVVWAIIILFALALIGAMFG